jgi:hypothetical protein
MNARNLFVFSSDGVFGNHRHFETGVSSEMTNELLVELSVPFVSSGLYFLCRVTWGEVVVRTHKLILAILLVSLSAAAQTSQVQAKPLTDDDIRLFRQDMQAAKDAVIKDTMKFTEQEATAFWPVYKQYAQEQHKIADRRLGIITDYAQKLDKMDDASASSLTQRLFQVEDEAQALRKNFFNRFESALGAKRAAKFYQVDNRLTMIVNIQLASEVPLIP